jgi:hypothetical protein
MNQFTATRTTFVSSTNASQTTSPAVQPAILEPRPGVRGLSPCLCLVREASAPSRSPTVEMVTPDVDGPLYRQQQLRELKVCHQRARYST